MFRSKIFFVLLFVASGTIALSQGLDKICPIKLQTGSSGNDVSFVLTTTDYNFFRNTPKRFENSIQIIDADQPWPPRWFSAIPFDTMLQLPYSALVPLNATYQDGKLSYFSVLKIKNKDNTEKNAPGFIICNSKLEIIDTFITPNQELDHHDFRIKPNGEKLFFALFDTVLDMSQIHNNVKETALELSYEIIEIADSTGKIIFSWDPLKQLGAAAQFPLYQHVKGIWNRRNVFDWSHGNSICFDYDGDILYSYKFIGIGKISRKDGHIIWKIDRSRQQANEFSDTIPFFLQHDLKCNEDASGNLFYSFFSNGDATHKFCSACQFTVKDTLNGQKIFRVKKRFEPGEKIPNTSGGGNYDVEEDGHYLINYGTFKGDSVSPRTLFEYRDGKDELIVRYTIDPFVLAYRVHKLNGWRPDRPEIKISDGSLTVNATKEITWYRLDEKTQKATMTAHGQIFKPSKPGLYCAAEKYGSGYAVSKPVAYFK